MRRVFSILSILLIFIVTGEPNQESAPEKTARAILSEIDSVTWSAPYPEKMAAEATETCETYRGTSYSRTLEEYWCHRCTKPYDTFSGSRFYYLLEESNAVCQLELFRVETTSMPETQLRELHHILEVALSRRFGVGGYNKNISGFCSSYWSEKQEWQTSDYVIWLYINRCHRSQVKLELVVRHRPLATAIEEANTWYLKIPEEEYPWLEPLGRKFLSELEGNYPKITTLLKEPEPNKKEIFQETLRILNMAETAPQQQRPILLLAADLLALRFSFGTETVGPDEKQMITTFTNRGLAMGESPLEAVWGYTHSLLWRVWKEYKDTAWGEEAFRALQRHGWDTSSTCAKGTDQFREVITQGERFLSEQPLTSHRLEIVMALATAYETWWSLSQASVQDNYVDPNRYHDGADVAYEKAMTYYKEGVRLAPESDQAQAAKRILARMQLGIDTGSRGFFCIYD